MATALTDGRVYAFAVYGAAQGQSIITITHWSPTLTGTGSPTMEDAIALIVTRWKASLRLVLSNEYVALSYTLSRISLITPVPGTGTPTVPYRYTITADLQVVQTGGGSSSTGVQDGQMMPTYVAATIQKRTPLRGRSTRGSLRLSPITEEQCVLNSLDSGARDTIQTQAESLFNPAGVTLTGTTGVVYPLVFSPVRYLKTNNVPRPTPSVTTGAGTYISSVYTNAFLGSQVSRKQINRLG